LFVVFLLNFTAVVFLVAPLNFDGVAEDDDSKLFGGSDIAHFNVIEEENIFSTVQM